MTKYAARGLAFEFEGTPVGQLTEFGEFGSARDLIDASAYGDDWKDYVTGQQDGTEVPAVIAYDPADGGHQDIIDSYETDPDAIVTFTAIHAPSSSSWDITCRITSVSRGGQLGDLLKLNVGLKIVDPGVVEGS